MIDLRLPYLIELKGFLGPSQVEDIQIEPEYVFSDCTGFGSYNDCLPFDGNGFGMGSTMHFGVIYGDGKGWVIVDLNDGTMYNRRRYE
jgi:hypothetical protein